MDDGTGYFRLHGPVINRIRYRDSVNVITDKQFADIFLYDGIVIVDADRETDLNRLLAKSSEINTYTSALMEVVTVYQQQGNKGYEANLLVPEHEGNFINFFALQERVSGIRCR